MNDLSLKGSGQLREIILDHPADKIRILTKIATAIANIKSTTSFMIAGVNIKPDKVGWNGQRER